jgi:hypothetical protein
MRHESLLDEDWPSTVGRPGGTAGFKKSARQTKAFLRGREFEDAIDMLRMVMAAAWAMAACDPRRPLTARYRTPCYFSAGRLDWAGRPRLGAAFAGAAKGGSLSNENRIGFSSVLGCGRGVPSLGTTSHIMESRGAAFL